MKTECTCGEVFEVKYCQAKILNTGKKSIFQWVCDFCGQPFTKDVPEPIDLNATKTKE